MFKKNPLTKITKHSILSLDAKCSELGGFTRLCVRKVEMLCAINPRASQMGVFCVFKNFTNFYVQLSTTTQQKTSSEKLASKTQIKYNKQIVSNFLDFVKEKFAIINFKPKSPVFSK